MWAHLNKKSRIHTTAIVDDCVEIGDNVEIGPFCVIGLEGEIRDDRNKDGSVFIGDNSRIRAHVTIDRGTEGRITTIGPNAYIMSKAHIGHDVVAGEFLTLATGAKVGGHCKLGRHVNIGLNAVIHQWREVGDYCMIGMGSVVNRSIFATLKVAGNPVRILGFNERYNRHEGYEQYRERFLAGDVPLGWLRFLREKTEGHIGP